MMISRPITRTVSLLAATLSLSACGGGGTSVGGATPIDTPPPIEGMSANTLEANTGVEIDTPATLLTVYTPGGSDGVPAAGDPYTEYADGTIVFSQGGGGSITTEVAYAQAGTYSQSERYDPDEDRGEYGPEIDTRTVAIGSQNARAGVATYSYNNTRIVYVPADGSDMRAGGYVHSDGTEGLHGIFGEQTSAEDLAAFRTEVLTTQGGQASYAGHAFATVDRLPGYDPDNPAPYAEGGLFDGEVTGVVDFDQARVTTQGTLLHERSQTVDGYANTGTDQITVTTENPLAPGGAMRVGTVTVGSADPDGNPIAGTAIGTFYGPEAQTMGILYEGSSADGDAGVVGHMILNAD